MLDPLAATNSLKDHHLVAFPVRRNKKVNGFPNDLLAAVAEDFLRGPVPGQHKAIEILADDCVLGGFNDCGEFLDGACAILRIR